MHPIETVHLHEINFLFYRNGCTTLQVNYKKKVSSDTLLFYNLKTMRWKSHDLTTLFSSLAEQLFAKPSLFSPPLIAVASYGMKRWLQLAFAEKGVCFGLEILSLHELQRRVAKKPLPTNYDYRLALALSDLEEPVQKELAALFPLYALFGEEVLEGWQKELYQSLPFSSLSSVSFVQREVHLFGFSYLPPLLTKKLEEIRAKMYILSPCQTHFGEGGHPLLESWGRLAKEWMEMPAKPLYPLPEGPITQGKALQLDLLFNRHEEEGGKFDFPSPSFFFHEVSSEEHEIEILYTHLLHLAEKPGFDPQEVLVMAPELDIYLPFIRAYFEQEDSPFDPLYFDVPKQEGNPYMALFKASLAWEKSGFDCKHFLKLFDYEPFPFTKEEQALIHTWIDAFGFCGGRWEEGYKKMAESIVENNVPSSVHLPLLGRFITKQRELQKALFLLRKGKKRLVEWHATLSSLTLLWVEEEPDSEEYLAWQECLSSILSPLFQESEAQFSFDLIEEKLLESMQQKEQVVGDPRLCAITFSSLFPNRAIPKKTIWLLGMHEESFPRRQQVSSLDLLTKKNKFYPTCYQQDRFALLETLFACRDTLCFSYHKDKGPSFLLLELLETLEKTTTIQGKTNREALWFHHPKQTKETPKTHPLSLPPLKTTNVELEELFAFAKDPLSYTLKKHHNIDLNPLRPDYPQERQPLSVSALDQAKWRQHLVDNAPAPTSHFPKRFHSLASLKIEETKHYLLQPSKESGFLVIELLEGVTEKRELDTHHTLLPPLVVGDIRLTGKLTGLVQEGVIAFRKEPLQDWPRLLLATLLGFPSKLIFWQEEEILDVCLDDPKTLLENYLTFFFAAQANPKPYQLQDKNPYHAFFSSMEEVIDSQTKNKLLGKSR